LSIEFYGPPKAILASGTKAGVELGGDKSILSVDGHHNLYNEGTIFTEMSWAAFYKEVGLEDQIDSFQTTEFKSVRDNPEALTKTIVDCTEKIIRDKKIFYGIADFEVDAFLNQNCVIPGLKLDSKIINQLMEAHKRSRNWNLFPTITQDRAGITKIKIEFQGSHKKNLRIFGSNLEDISDKLRLVKGFATGIVCASRGAANFYIMNDNISFKEDEISEFYIDDDNIAIIEMGIQRELLFPISWFRIDLGIRSLETLELWDDIKNKPQLQKVFEKYENYISELVYKKYRLTASGEEIGTDLEEDFYNMSPAERKKALKDMADAIKILTKKYKE
jgi:hypothetical protein